MPLLRLLCCLLLCATTLGAQRLGPEPKRPKLPVGADTNDASAYLAFGTRQLEQSVEAAAAAFYWAARLDPGSADALYGRRVSMLMRKPPLLKLYMQGGRRSRDSKDLKAIDSLRMRAFRFDPFLYRRFDRAMIIAYYRDENRMAFGTASAAELDRAIIDYLESAGPSTRAWMFYSEGRLDQALVEYNHAIERSKAPGYLRIDKARTLVMQGMNKLALEELTRALEDLRKKEDDKDEDVRFYDSKALVEHGIGILYGKLGDADSAKAALGRAMTEDLSYFAAHVELGRLALEEKDTVTAVSELGLAAELATDEPWVHYLQGSTLVATGNPTDAIAPLRKAIAMEPLYAAPQFALGQALEATGDAAGAKTAYENFLSMAPRRDAQRAIASDRLAALGGGDKK